MKWSILALAAVCSGCGFVHNVLGEMGGASVSVNGNTIQVRVKGGESVKDAGKMSTVSPEMGSFTKVELSLPFQATIEAGKPQSVEIEADEAVAKLISAKVEDGVLVIKAEGSFETKSPLRLRVSAPTLVGLEAGSSAKIVVLGVKADRFALALHGATSADWKGEVQKLDLELSGASRATLMGKVDEAQLELSGASRLEAEDVQSRAIEGSLSGASQASVSATQRLKVDASGASTLRYKGEPGERDTHTSGASRIEKL